MSKASNLDRSPYKLTIRGKTYNVHICYFKQDQLRFYPENPRIYSVLHNGTKAPSQDDIEEHLQKMDYVKDLRDDIKDNGDLIEPLYVKESTKEVVEGNSRLAAYRLLAEENAVQWELVKCVLLPKEVDDSAIASLLGQLHLRGKKDWPPFEQASFLHRRHHKDKISIKELTKEFNIKENFIKHRIAVIDFMEKHGDNKVDRWSYYDEFLKSRKIQKACEDHADFEAAVVEKIKTGTIKKAQDLRDKLKVVCGARSEKPIKQLIAGADLDDAFKSAKSLGGDHKVLHKLTGFRTWIGSTTTKQAVKDSPTKVKEQLVFELKEIKKQAERILKAAKS